MLRLLSACLGLFAHTAFAASLEIDLTEQRASLRNGDVVLESAPISSGTASHPTPTGMFRVIEKKLTHFSTQYGRIVSASGRVLQSDANGFAPLPRGARFVASPMPYFLRFEGGNGLHAGHLPGYPASHGCVRMPRDKAKIFFEKLEVGDVIRIVGRAPPPPASTLRAK